MTALDNPVATKAHRDGLNKRLKTNGLDISVASEQGRFIALDAAATLEKISRDGRIDGEVFRESLGELMDRARGSPRHTADRRGRAASLNRMCRSWLAGQTMPTRPGSGCRRRSRAKLWS